jgi:hypothetical protein
METDMTEYQIQPHTRRCHASGRELKAGERFYSVLLDEGGKLVRYDYGGEAWAGPPTQAFSFWTGRVPAESAFGLRQVDDQVLLDYFERLDADEGVPRTKSRYVVALLLMRRRKLKFEEAVMEGGQEMLVLRCAETQKQYRVLNPRLTDEELAAVQDEVFGLLGWH